MIADELAPAAAFTPGNLVIYRVGDGVAALNSNATAVFLDEYTPAGVLVQSLPMPTTASGSNRRLLASGSAASEGLITRSVDGQYLVFAGYDAAAGTGSITTSTSAIVNRVIGRTDANGTTDTTTALSDAISVGNPRGAASTNGTDLWISGTSAGGGIRYASFGSTTSTSLTTTSTNFRSANIFSGQLYSSSMSGTFRLSTVGTGVPITSGQTATNLPGFPTATGSPYQFFFADLSAGVAGVDTVYVADDNSVAGGGGAQKYSLVGGSWTLNGTLSLATTRGLTGVVSGANVTLYVTGGSPTTALQTVTDTSGYNSVPTGTFSLLATASTNTAFRGVALAPVASTAANVSLAGRVRTSDGRVIRNAVVTISGNSLPAQVRTLSSSLGSYRFDDLPAGEMYVVTINSKRFTFQIPSRVVSLTDSIFDLDFVAEPQE